MLRYKDLYHTNPTMRLGKSRQTLEFESCELNFCLKIFQIKSII